MLPLIYIKICNKNVPNRGIAFVFFCFFIFWEILRVAFAQGIIGENSNKIQMDMCKDGFGYLISINPIRIQPDPNPTHAYPI